MEKRKLIVRKVFNNAVREDILENFDLLSNKVQKSKARLLDEALMDLFAKYNFESKLENK